MRLKAQPESFPSSHEMTRAVTGTETQTSVAKSPSVHKSCLMLVAARGPETVDDDSERRRVHGVLRHSPHQQVLPAGLRTPIREERPVTRRSRRRAYNDANLQTIIYHTR